MPIFTVGTLRPTSSWERNLALIELTRYYSMIVGRLYKQGKDGVLNMCIEKEDSISYLEQAHVAIGNIHMTPEQTVRRIERMGVYWPTMKKDVYDLVRGCSCRRSASHVHLNFITLYQMTTIAPKWADTLVEFLSTNVFPEKMSKLRQRYL